MAVNMNPLKSKELSPLEKTLKKKQQAEELAKQVCIFKIEN